MTAPSSIDPTELHLLYVLLDSNLPTGGFVSSSGLESYAKHGFLSLPPLPSSSSSIPAAPPIATPVLPPRPSIPLAITRFASAELQNYASTTLHFVASSHRLASSSLSPPPSSSFSPCSSPSSSSTPSVPGPQRDTTTVLDLKQLVALDHTHEACMLSHVARRSSRAQGVALLTLYARGLSRPAGFAAVGDEEERARALVDGFKRLVRKGDTPGHLAVCWGVICVGLSLPLERTLHLHLFLHARSLLSSAVRLNLIGPYVSSQLLLHAFREMIDRELSRFLGTTSPAWSMGPLSSSLPPAEEIKCGQSLPNGEDAVGGKGDFWAWTAEAESGPSTTWPLGEVLMARHDLQHSRIFNS